MGNIFHAAARLPGRLIPSRIRWKIAAPYVVLTLVVAVAGTYVATRIVTSSLESRFSTQLTDAAQVTSDALVLREDDHLETVRSIIYTAGVTEAVEGLDQEQLNRLIEPILANDRRDYAHVFDSQGDLLLSLRLADSGDLEYEAIADPPGLWSAPVVQTVLDGGDSLGDKSAELLSLPDQTILYTAGPIRDGDTTVGVVVVGSSLSTFLPAIKRDAQSDITFYGLGGTVLGTTLPGDPGSLASALSGAEPTDQGIADLAGLRQSTRLSGHDYDLVYGDLRLRGETIGLFSVSLPSSFIAGAGSNTRITMLAIFGAATISVLAIGAAVAHGVTKPLLSLVRSAHVISSGDLTVRAAVKSHDEVGTLAASFNVMTERLANQHLQTIRALTSAIDARDPYTAGHSVRVGQLSMEIGRELGLPKRDLQYLEVGGYLHDIGKIGIRDHILLKEGPLTVEERRLIEDHPRIGLSIVQHIELADEVLDVVGGHHEKLDGTGYPYGRVDEDITIFVRIAAVSDIYDALTTERPYKPALTVERAVEMLQEENYAGRLDKRVVDGLIRALPRWRRRLSIEKSLRGFSMQDLDGPPPARKAV